MKSAAAYKRGKLIILHPWARTVDGVWVVESPCTTLLANSDCATIGYASLAAIKHSRVAVPHPREWGEVLKPLLQAAGARSWRDFVKGAACVTLEEEGGELRMIPSVNRGSSGGFDRDESRALSLPLPAPPSVIGQSLLDLLAVAH